MSSRYRNSETMFQTEKDLSIDALEHRVGNGEEDILQKQKEEERQAVLFLKEQFAELIEQDY